MVLCKDQQNWQTLSYNEQEIKQKAKISKIRNGRVDIPTDLTEMKSIVREHWALHKQMR